VRKVVVLPALPASTGRHKKWHDNHLNQIFIVIRENINNSVRIKLSDCNCQKCIHMLSTLSMFNSKCAYILRKGEYRELRFTEKDIWKKKS